jgi:cation transport ATPase
VGVAMGVKATAVAMETADVALMDSDLRKLALAGKCLLLCLSVVVACYWIPCLW